MSTPALTRPQTTSIDLTLRADIYATGWHSALSRPPKLKLLSLPLDASAAPAVATVRVGRQQVKTFSLVFPEAPIPAPPPSARPTPPQRKPAENNAAPRQTRIKPPGDVVKLEDRLHYILQPPLESLVAAGEVRFPFDPFPYQYEGVAFLYPRYAAVLADEMGLGKTMQAITTIRLLLMSGELTRVLLICPKPLVTNWRREFNLWAPEVPLGVIDGDQATRAWQWTHEAAAVKIANYELLLRDEDLLEQLRFDLVVLDEAQRVKNTNSTTSRVARSIARTRNWALTGTPIENRPDDLVGIFEFLSPGFLNTSMSLSQMGKSAGDFILRRTKDKVLTDLPPKMYRDAELSLTPEQYATYKTAEDEGVIQLDALGDSITVQHVFELVLRLKQICNFDPATGASCKLERLLADLEEVAASGKKAIIFSQWVSVLERLKEQLDRFGPLEYHGKIPSARRDGVIERFKNDPAHNVILMSYGAGSVGLNLQFCEYVFLFDRWWNPAVEDQAINRAHRIGAAGPVTVTRMLAVDTIEERINQVLEEKREMFATLFSEASVPKSAGLSQSEIFGLFQLRTPSMDAKAA